MTYTWKGVGEGLKICHMFSDSFIFKQNFYRSFLLMEVVGGDAQLVIFCGRHKSMIPRWVNFRAPFLQVSAWKVSKYRVFSCPSFPVFGLNTEIYSVNFLIQSKYGIIRTRKNSAFGHFSTGLVVFFPDNIKKCCLLKKISIISFILFT